MIIVKIFGGIGNQMFQYAAAKSLAIKHNCELKLDIDSYNNQSISETKRTPSLSIFKNISNSIASDKEVKSIIFKFKSSLINRFYRVINRKFRIINRAHIIQNGFSFYEIKIDKKSASNVYLDGYWQSENHFKDVEPEIKKSFDLEYLNKTEYLQKYIAEINNSNSVSIHVRRGDYITNKNANSFHGICSINYYNKAINTFIEKGLDDLTFFVFSDDIPWCKENLKITHKCVFVSTKHDFESLYLMKKCKHNIIANSSFSWWGAWLNSNPNKIVIAPKPWFKNENVLANNLVPDTWLKIDRDR